MEEGIPEEDRIQAMKLRQLGVNLASLADYDLQDAIDTVRKLGFSSIELPAFRGVRHSVGEVPGFWFDELTEDEREELKEALRGFGHICLHAPFVDLPLFTSNPGVREEALDQIRMTLEAAWFLGAEVVTVHANHKTGYSLEEFYGEMVDAFRKLGDFALGCNTKIGIETGYPDRVREYLKLILDVGHEAVGATLDVGHIKAYLSRNLLDSERGPELFNETLLYITRTLGSVIFHIHLHDLRPGDWRDHRRLGGGVVDWKRFMEVLEGIGYQGPMVFELEEEDREGALLSSRDYLEGMAVFEE